MQPESVKKKMQPEYLLQKKCSQSIHKIVSNWGTCLPLHGTWNMDSQQKECCVIVGKFSKIKVVVFGYFQNLPCLHLDSLGACLTMEREEGTTWFIRVATPIQRGAARTINR